MFHYLIYLRASDQAIEGEIKKPDQLRELMRAPTNAGTIFELTDNESIVIVRPSEVSGVSYEEIKAPK